MSRSDREELLALVDELSDEQARAVLAVVRPYARPVGDRPWPPAFFGSAPGEGPPRGKVEAAGSDDREVDHDDE